jgi:hypothetical protein
MKLLAWIDEGSGFYHAKTRIFLQNGVEIENVRSITTLPPVGDLPRMSIELLNVQGEMVDAKPACIVDELLDHLDMLAQGLQWNIENHPEAMNQADDEALASTLDLIQKHRPKT